MSNSILTFTSWRMWTDIPQHISLFDINGSKIFWLRTTVSKMFHLIVYVCLCVCVILVITHKISFKTKYTLEMPFTFTHWQHLLMITWQQHWPLIAPPPVSAGVSLSCIALQNILFLVLASFLWDVAQPGWVHTMTSRNRCKIRIFIWVIST